MSGAQNNSKGKYFGLLVAVAVVLGIVAWIVSGGIAKRVLADGALKKSASEASVWSVQVVKPLYPCCVLGQR